MLLLLLASSALAAGPGARLDPRLTGALAPGAEPVSVWVEFADKGEQGPADLAARLAEAERNLSPANRARRVWAGVHPLVDYLDLPLDPNYVEALRAAGYQPYGQSRWFNGVAVRASGEQLARLAELGFVRGLSPAPLAMPSAKPPVTDDQTFLAPPRQGLSAGSTQVDYGQTAAQLAQIGVPAVHDSGYVGTGILVAVLDAGFNFYRKHEATRTIPIPGGHVRDFVDGDFTVQDTTDLSGKYNHGQYVLSCIAGNKPGVYVGPGFGATYALGRTENDGTETPVELVNWAMGAEWADSLGARIISSSLGYNVMDNPNESLTWPMMNGHTTLVTRAAQIAASRGILVVNSAGNDGSKPYPGHKIAAPADANGDSVLAIGAVNSSGVRATFSSRGPTYDGRIKPDLAALGVAVPLASASGNPNTYTTANGTSFSCPLTAGLAACLMQARPTWPPAMIVRAMRESASQFSAPDTMLGYGIPNGLAALRWGGDVVHVPDSIAGRLAFRLQSSNPLRPGDDTELLNFAIPASSSPANGRIRVYDTTGRAVATPWSGALQPGVEHREAWDGGQLRAGLYLVSFESGGDRVTRRLVVIR
jgi:subtilisin family serine protease